MSHKHTCFFMIVEFMLVLRWMLVVFCQLNLLTLDVSKIRQFLIDVSHIVQTIAISVELVTMDFVLVTLLMEELIVVRSSFVQTTALIHYTDPVIERMEFANAQLVSEEQIVQFFLPQLILLLQAGLSKPHFWFFISLFHFHFHFHFQSLGWMGDCSCCNCFGSCSYSCWNFHLSKDKKILA